MATAARNSTRFHGDRHENPNRPLASRDAIDCSPANTRALAFQARAMILVTVALAAALMWLLSNG